MNLQGHPCVARCSAALVGKGPPEPESQSRSPKYSMLLRPDKLERMLSSQVHTCIMIFYVTLSSVSNERASPGSLRSTTSNYCLWLFLSFCFAALPASAANHYVRAGAAAAGSG